MNESDKICHLADLGFKIARPKGFKPHAVERLFRESVKAITELRGIDLSDAIIERRSPDASRRLSTEWGMIRLLFQKEWVLMPRQMSLLTYFVDKILNGICEGKPGRLKKMSNSLADGNHSSYAEIRRRLLGCKENEVKRTWIRRRSI